MTRSTPGIDDVEFVETPEVLEVSGHDGHVVDQGGRADEGVAERCGIRYVQDSRATHNALVHRQNSTLERCGDALVKPCTQHCSLRRI